MTDAQLRDYWRELATILAAKEDPLTGALPPYWQLRFESVRDEFARRGVQLALFTE